MMTWILGKIVELLESGETNWRTEKCGRKAVNNSAKSMMKYHLCIKAVHGSNTGSD